MKDYYYILGINANATTVEIREAYRKLSKKFHPDLNQNDEYFDNRFKAIQEAYDIFSDPVQRERYDQQFARQDAPPPPAGKHRPYRRTTAIDVIFTIILIAITLVFADYVWKSVYGGKTKPTIAHTDSVSTVLVPPVATVVHHKKKKHGVKSLVAVNTPKAILVAEKPKPAPPAKPLAKPQSIAVVTTPSKKKIDTIKLHPVQVAVVRPAPVPVIPVSNRSDGLPYSSYLRANVTGVVNMHRMDNIGSDVVAVVPAQTKVLVLAKGDTYYKVQYNDAIGYVPRWTVITK